MTALSLSSDVVATHMFPTFCNLPIVLHYQGVGPLGGSGGMLGWHKGEVLVLERGTREDVTKGYIRVPVSETIGNTRPLVAQLPLSRCLQLEAKVPIITQPF